MTYEKVYKIATKVMTFEGNTIFVVKMMNVEKKL